MEPTCATLGLWITAHAGLSSKASTEFARAGGAGSRSSQLSSEARVLGSFSAPERAELWGFGRRDPERSCLMPQCFRGAGRLEAR